MLKRLLFTTLATLLLLEVVLQAGALLVHLTGRKEPARDERRPVILCIGDSFTFGIGASGPGSSYPSRLQDLLDAAGERWQVVSQGLPGGSSRQLLERLPWQLAHWRPERVYIQVGFNDVWKRPEELRLSEGDRERLAGAGAPGFELRWRTARFVAWLLTVLRGREQFLEQPQPSGLDLRGTAWRGGGLVVAFGADGRLHLPGATLTWERADGTLEIQGAGLRMMRFECELRGGRLILSNAAVPAPLVLERLTPPSPPQGAGREGAPAPESPAELERRGLSELEAADFETAAALLGRAVQEAESPTPRALAALARAAHFAGRHERALDAIAELERLLDERPRAEVAELLLTTLAEVGETARVHARLPGALARFPEAAGLWLLQARRSLEGGDRARARAELARALSSSARADTDLAAACHRLAAEIELPDDPRASLRHLLQAYRIDGDVAELTKGVERGRTHYDAELLRELLDQVGLTGDARREAEAFFLRAVEDDRARMQDHYASHLRQMIELCRDAGATPALIGYPFRDRLARVRARVARETDTESVTMAAVFDAALEDLPRSALFVPDGHCNDDGYAIMARVVLEALHHEGR